MKGEIEKRGKNSYRIRIYLGRDEEGIKKYHAEVFRGSKKDAEGRRAELLLQSRRGELVEATAMKIISCGLMQQDTEPLSSHCNVTA